MNNFFSLKAVNFFSNVTLQSPEGNDIQLSMAESIKIIIAVSGTLIIYKE